MFATLTTLFSCPDPAPEAPADVPEYLSPWEFEQTDPVEAQGIYSLGFEWSGFAPCHSDETWWLELPRAFREQYQALGEDTNAVVLHFNGLRIRRKGGWGHLGSYDYLARPDEVLHMRPATHDDLVRCPQRIIGVVPLE